jgi:hypothetical protein
VGSLQVSGFALLRGAAVDDESAALRADELAAQSQVGIDWTPGPRLWGHVHALARTDDDESRDGSVGVVEAFLEASFPVAEGRVRLRGGAMFLPSSLENVDALWQTPYTITPSALNTWLGEELRPIGLDAAYSRSGLTIGGTLFRGNDTFGALPPVRGWAFHDRWILLGEEIPIDEEVYTSVSDENDGRLGWSGRAGWQGRRVGVRFTHVDNRSDGLLYGDLYNWNTRLDIVGIEATRGGLTVAAESGWGPTYLVVEGQRIVSDLRASYVLLSKRLRNGRVSLRLDHYDDGDTTDDHYDDGDTTDDAVTAAWLWSSSGKVSAGVEGIVAGGSARALVQVRYAFASP